MADFDVVPKVTPMMFNVEFTDVVHISDVGETYILVDENGNEMVGVLVSEETVFTATADDIRRGKVAVTEEGVTEGTKDIPSYHTNEGYRLILNGRPFELTLAQYDYTKLQSIICFFDKNLQSSVSAEKVSIDDSVYDVQSNIAVSNIKKNDIEQKIDFGIVNTSGRPYVIRYFMYKEIY